MKFELVSSFKPTGDQPQAIESLLCGLSHGQKHQVLLGVTGSGKTFTMANVIAQCQKPTLVISHNKTLAAQLFQEFRTFFPKNAVSFFVSYYDYYQPEAYIPKTDTYIEKETEINEEIDKLRLASTINLLTRRDTIIVASVSCIYNIGSPKEYGHFVLELREGVKLTRESIIKRLVDLQYTKNNYQFRRGNFRVRGEIIDIFPSYSDRALRLTLNGDCVTAIEIFNPVDGRISGKIKTTVIYPTKHYMTDSSLHQKVFAQIRKDLKIRTKELLKEGKKLEAYRLRQKVNYDLEMIEEIGYVNGIENYSRYFDGRNPGEPPFTLLDYFSEPYGNDWLLFLDESHITIPQIRGMYNGDQSRKSVLIDFGFRLPSALDNRPLTFSEFLHKIPQAIYLSATPDTWEISLSRKEAFRKPCKNNHDGITEQLVRPTGIVDPKIIIRQTQNQINDLVKEIIKRKKRNERVLVTTLTKKTAEDLSAFLNERKYINFPGFRKLQSLDFPLVHYLHSDIETLERTDILDDLRQGKYDVVIGINLLREGLDLPEVSLVAILDADKEGFLRSEVSLIQTMGRASRRIDGLVIMYADAITNSMRKAMKEINRRRKIQKAYNKKYRIIPQNIIKPIREKLVEKDEQEISIYQSLDQKKKIRYKELLSIDINQLTPQDKVRLIKQMEREMRDAASSFNFELAAEIRDKIIELKSSN